MSVFTKAWFLALGVCRETNDLGPETDWRLWGPCFSWMELADLTLEMDQQSALELSRGYLAAWVDVERLAS